METRYFNSKWRLWWNGQFKGTLHLSCLSNRIPFSWITKTTLSNRLVICLFSDISNKRHRYNLKRKVAELPPVTAEVFAQKVLGIPFWNDLIANLLAQQDQLRLSASQANYSQTCPACKKTFYSQNSYNNHLLSKRHKLATARSLNRLDALKDDNESIAGSIDSGTIDMMGSVISVDNDSVQAIEDGVDKLEIVDEVFPPWL